MNPEIIKGQVRSWLIFIGGIVGGYGVSRKWFTSDQITGFINSETVISVIAAVIGMGWSAFTHQEANAVAVVAKIAADPASPVKGVVVEQTNEGRVLAKDIINSDTSAVIAPAGTDAAARIAKSSTAGAKA